MKKHLPALFLALFIIANAQAAENRDKAVDAVFAEYAHKETPGCAVGVAQNGKVLLSKGYGSADLETATPITQATVFEAGSVSKQITAAALAILATRGRLSLDDDVRLYLPELPDYGAKLTIRHLLTHTSGLREWSDLVALEGWPRGTRAIDQSYAAAAIFRQPRLNFAPGAQYRYSNSNYVLAALIVERVSGASLPDFTRANLFAPLGMLHTGWRADYAAILPGRAQAYEPDRRGGWRLAMPFEDVIGHAGMLTTIGDLLRWNEALTHPKPEDAAWVALLQEEGKLNDGRKAGYALGLAIGETSISHTGSTAGYRAFLGRWPASGLSVVTLCNASTALGGRLGSALKEIFVPSGLKLPPPPIPHPPVAVPQDLTPYAGRYHSDEANALLTVQPAGDALEFVAASGLVIRAVPQGFGKFRDNAYPWEVTFTEDGFLISSDRSEAIRFTRSPR